MNIPLDKAEILALFLETFLYGIFFTLYWITVLIVVQRGQAGHVQRTILIPVASLMLSIATGHLIIDFVRVVEAFVGINSIPGSANIYYDNIANPLHVVKTALYVTQTLLGDGVIVCFSTRSITAFFMSYIDLGCYAVNKTSLFVRVPAMAVLAVNACAGYVVVWSLSQATPGSDVFNTASSWITTFFVLTMCINLTCTIAIAWRIFWTRSFISTTNSLLPVAIVIVESGALYASGVLGLLVAYLTRSNGQYPALDVVTPLVGIAFTLIVLQIRFHIGTSNRSDNPIGSERMFGPLYWRQCIAQNTSGADISGCPMQPMAIQITGRMGLGNPDEVRTRESLGDEEVFSSQHPIEKVLQV